MPGVLAFLPHFWIVYALKLAFVEFCVTIQRLQCSSRSLGASFYFSIGPKDLSAFVRDNYVRLPICVSFAVPCGICNSHTHHFVFAVW